MEDGSIGSDDIVVCEILSRLPVKSLMRFKCVSKHWLKLIEEDSYFIDLHLARSKARTSLFCVIKDPRDRYQDKRFKRDEFFLTADLSSEGIADIDTIRRTNLFCYDQILGPINGLICFVDKHKYAVCIYNISTREASPWIHSTLFQDGKKKHPEIYRRNFGSPIYKFGFDPTTKEHKVLCMWSIPRGGSHDADGNIEVCEILTLRKGTWRRIDEVPACCLGDRFPSVCVNGSIYWCTDMVNHPQECHGGYPLCIATFDFGTEKFRMIQIPNFNPDQPLDPDEHIHSYVRLIEVAGAVAVVLRSSAYVIKLWILHDQLHDNEKDNRTMALRNLADRVSTEETITLPFPWDRNLALDIYGVAGTLQIILLSYRAFKGYIKCVSLHSYHHKEKHFTDIITTGAHISIPGFSCIKLFTPFVESLLRVQKQRSNSTSNNFTPSINFN